MTALHKHCTAILVVKTGGKLPRMSRISRATFSRINGNSAKRLGLGQVRRDERGKRKKTLRESCNCIVRHEPRAARRDHHRVYHLCNLRMPSKPVCDDFDCGRICKHPRLERATLINAKNRVKLRSNKVGRNGMERRNSRWSLRRQRRKDSATMKPVGVESAQIRLNASVAARITSGNGKTARRYCIFHDTYYITRRQRIGRRFDR